MHLWTLLCDGTPTGFQQLSLGQILAIVRPALPDHCRVALLRYNVPREGRNEVRLTSTSLQDRALFIGLGAVVVSLLLMVGLFLLRVEKSIACWIACIPSAAAFPPMLYLLHKSDSQQRTADERAAGLAPARWQKTEGMMANVLQDAKP